MSDKSQIRTLLEALETEINATLKITFGNQILVAEKLKRIRDEGLYEASHAHFDYYMMERWHLGKTATVRLLNAVEVFHGIEKAGLPAPANEFQLRAITENKITPSEGVAIWKAAVKTAGKNPITGSLVASLIEQRPRQLPAVKPPKTRDIPTQDISITPATPPVAPVSPPVAQSQEDAGEDEEDDGLGNVDVGASVELESESHAFQRLRGVVQDSLLDWILSGRFKVAHTDMDKWADMNDEAAFQLGQLLMGGNWTFKKAYDFILDVPKDSDRVSDLINRCLATRDHKIRLTFGKFNVDVYKTA